MAIHDLRKTPFPWFGGKSDAAPAVWEALGDVNHYVEPFAGSLAVLMRRPHTANRTYYSETVNDAGFDGEHGSEFVDAGWREVEWYRKGHLKGGMGNVGANGSQMHRDRLWLSPSCLAPNEEDWGMFL